MKVSINLEFNSMEEASAYLASANKEYRVNLPEDMTVDMSKVKVEAQEGKPLKTLGKKELQARCDQLGIKYTTRTTIAELVDLIENGVPVEEPVEVEAEVVEAVEVEVPAPAATPVQAEAINEAPATTSTLSKEDLIGQFTSAYEQAVASGVNEETLRNNIGSQLSAMGHPGVRLSLLPDDVLASFVPYFVEQTNGLMAQGNQQNNFI